MKATIPEAAKALAKRSKSPRRDDTSRPSQTTAVVVGHNRGVPIVESVVRAASTIDEFAAAHRISKPMVYKLWKDGRGPKFMIVGSRRYISNEAAAAWRKKLEQQASSAEALPQIEARKQRAIATVRARRFDKPKPNEATLPRS